MLDLSGLYFAYFDCWSQVISDYQIKQPYPFEPYTFHSDRRSVRQYFSDHC